MVVGFKFVYILCKGNEESFTTIQVQKYNTAHLYVDTYLN